MRIPDFWLCIICLVGFEILGAVNINQYETNKYQAEAGKIAIQTEKNKISELSKIISVIENHYTKPHEYLFQLPPIVSEDADHISSFYGYRNDPLRANSGSIEMKYHAALDLTGVIGARLQAIGSGVIENKWYPKGWHNGRWYNGHELFNGYVQIRLDNGYLASYGHIFDIIVREGDIINTGDIFARISTEVDDKSTGMHVHFSLQDEKGEFVQPQKYINFKGE